MNDHQGLVSKLVRFYSIHTPGDAIGAVRKKCESLAHERLNQPEVLSRLLQAKYGSDLSEVERSMQGDVVQMLTSKLLMFYSIHTPDDAIGEVNIKCSTLASRKATQQEDLNRKLREKYGSDLSNYLRTNEPGGSPPVKGVCSRCGKGVTIFQQREKLHDGSYRHLADAQGQCLIVSAASSPPAGQPQPRQQSLPSNSDGDRAGTCGICKQPVLLSQLRTRDEAGGLLHAKCVGRAGGLHLP